MQPRQRIFQPSDVPNDVFRINDITPPIPPTSIEVRVEDLTYRYRTLRSKTATKVNTGSGQISLGITIPFLNDHLMSLHRLIIEIRNSPFVWIDNRYIRESIVPEWPHSQQMAFTITGLSVSNMPNTTNGWILQLDATWFCYFPYMHNYLFREDWATNWLRSESEGEKLLQSFTIGWKLDSEHNREYYANSIGQMVSEGANLIPQGGMSFGKYQPSDKYSVVQENYLNVEHQRTIHEMEQSHPGIEFDLLPLPGNMRPAGIVQQPKDSRIFVRYQNFLQRDALMKNFGIDVRADVLAYEEANNQPGLFDSLFNVGTTRDGLPTVIPLDSPLVPRSLHRKWIATMLESNHSIKFHYHVFKEIRMPQKWTDNLENKRNQVVQDLFGRFSAFNNFDEIQKGSSDGASETIPVLGAKFPITSPYGERTHPTKGTLQLHTGVDIGAPRGTPVLSPESGLVVVAKKGDSVDGNYAIVKSENGTWSFSHLDQLVVKAGDTVEKGKLIGTVGNTGRTTAIQPNGTRDETKGFHLHLQYAPGPGKTPVDPIPYLRNLINEPDRFGTSEQEESYLDESIESPVESRFDYTPLPQTNKEQLIELAKREAQETLSLTEEETNALSELMAVLDSEGWSYYDQDTTVVNVWKKAISLQIKNSGFDLATGKAELPEEFKNAGIILTSISGTLSHIVAQIPILGHEFPTQQHLGSVEPEYQIEFAVLDDQSNLEGISSMAQLVQGMRSELQANSRKFRPVMDGWCVATDTFLTRLLGTYHVHDFRKLMDAGQLVDLDLRKRSIVSSAYDGTVQGNPGLSTINLNIQETNPYLQENLVSTSSGLQDKEAARGEVLRALSVLELVDKYKDLLAPLFIAQKLHAQLENTNAPDFGLYSIKEVNSFAALNGLNTQDMFYYAGGENGEKQLLLRSSNPQELQFLKTLGLEAEYYGDSEEFIQLRPEQLDADYMGLINYSANPFVNPVFQSSSLNKSIDSSLLMDDRFVLSGSSVGFDHSQAAIYDKAFVYNIAAIAEQNPALAQIPIQKVMDYYMTLSLTMQTSARMFAEEETGGLPEARVKSQLYALPVKQEMWKTWQVYLEEFVQVSNTSDAGTALNELSRASRGWNSGLPEEARSEMRAVAGMGFSFSGFFAEDVMWEQQLPFDRAATLGISPFSSSTDSTDVARNRHSNALDMLVGRYMLRALPLQVSLPDYLKDEYQGVLGQLVGDTSQGGKVPALDYMSKYLRINADSPGNISYNYGGFPSAVPVWRSDDPLDGNTDRAGLFGMVGANIPVLVNPTLRGAYNSTVESSLYAIENNSNGLLEGSTEYLFQEREFRNKPGSPFKYTTETGFEDVKVQYVKRILAGIADKMLGDYRMLQMLGLEHLMFLDENRDFEGMQCYPDLELPAHPYYGTTKAVSPDFYMWNIYEDGGALGPDQLAAIQTQVDYVVKNSYDSMNRMSAGDKYDPRTENQVVESSVDDPLILASMMIPEGTEGMETPYAPSKAAQAAVKEWNGLVVAANGSDDPDGKKLTSSKPSDFLKVPRLSNTEGHGGVGGGIHYPRRTDKAHYDFLKSQFSSTTHMFGSSEGYLNQELSVDKAREIVQATTGTNLERVPETAHNFDLKSLQQLSKDSSKDLISQKMSMKRAFPTYKLYFVEEDEFETRFLNFDDFYSYNAVKEITVVQSRKIAADHAVITLQNINGTLDGTRRNSISDLDYYADEGVSTSAKQKFKAHEDTTSSVISNDPITSGTSSEQPFGSVVLRPGLNVQLRLGSSNDPGCLQVMLSGRVVDVTWNTSGDLAEIMIQSFGAELEQVIKGTGRDGNVRTYATTHELLGSMMLEPEVVHFGRWEFGQQFQVGEGKDYRLDFVEYSKEGSMGKFGVSSWLAQWMMKHPYLTLGIGLGASVVSLFPFGRVLGGGGKLASGLGLSRVGGFLTKAGASRGIGYSGYVAALETGDDVARLAAATAAGNRLLLQATRGAKILGGGARGEAFLKAVASKADEAAKAYFAATDVKDQAIALAKLESFIQTTVFKGRWMAKPWAELGGAGFWSAASATGLKPLGTLVGAYATGNFKVAAGAFMTAAAVDLVIANLLRPIYNQGREYTSKFFTRTQATLFLTPQDDNLYPPHPKDYMTLDNSKLKNFVEYGLQTSSMLATGSTEAGISAFGFFYPDRILTKKVNPSDCKYQPVSTSIWGMFHEMSLRHPGWVYGARPYGNAYRYTMFFGLPAQRYWARPASNAFISRANQLYKFLNNSDDQFSDGNGNLVSEYEFKALYGDATYKEILDRTTYAKADTLSKAGVVNAVRNQMTAVALTEYLRAVQIRFEPFRRYHLLTSERDIVWNGIMGSENAVTNAVDITYFRSVDSASDPQDAEINSAVFKAHSFIPESKLRIAPVRWPNCLGYGMAQRYAMGELCNRMRDMYRGELIVLGNPRIRPLDVGIIVDSYNSMTGPIEVEQVVHTYSHETGFITEIKPSAVLFANEISGWPMIEAMKLYALAVQNIHERYAGIKADNGSSATDPGSLATAATVLAALPGAGFGDRAGQYNSFIQEKYNKLFPDGVGASNMFGSEPPPDLTGVDSFISDVYQNALGVSTGIGIAGLATGLVGTAGAIAANSKAGGVINLFGKSPKSLAYGAGLIGLAGFATAAVGIGAPLAVNQIDFPGLAFLMGGSTLFMQCLRNDAIILVPLIKSGSPIVAGLAFNDPALMWSSFRGRLDRYFTETMNGTVDMLGLYKRYGSEIWTRMNQEDLGQTTSSVHESQKRIGRWDSPQGSVNEMIIEGMTGE